MKRFTLYALLLLAAGSLSFLPMACTSLPTAPAGSAVAPTPVPCSTCPSQTYNYVTDFGASGLHPLNYPAGLLFTNNTLFVVDYDNNNMSQYTASGNYVRQFGQMYEPWNGSVDRYGNIFVAGYGDHTVYKYNVSGQLVFSFGTSGTAPGQLYYPIGVTTDVDGNIYVADYSIGNIQEFSPQGVFLSRFADSGPGALYHPYSLVQANGLLYAADYSHNRIAIYNTQGAYITQITNSLYSPSDVKLDAAGNLYVSTDSSSSAPAYKFDPRGNILAEIGSRSGLHALGTNLDGIAVDPAGNVYLADSDNSRVMKFAPAQ